MPNTDAVLPNRVLLDRLTLHQTLLATAAAWLWMGLNQNQPAAGAA